MAVPKLLSFILNSIPYYAELVGVTKTLDLAATRRFAYAG